MAYDSLDPIGKQRDEFGWAMICSMMYNLVADIYAKKGSPPKHTTPYDFMPDWGGAGKPRSGEKGQTVEEQKAILLQLVKNHNRIFGKKKE